MTNPSSIETTRFALLESPVGELLALGDADGRLTGLHFDGDPRSLGRPAEWIRDDDAFGELRDQLDAYFAGELEHFELQLRPRGSAFQLGVWSALREIPYGQTASYGEIATAVGQPGAARAVGGANNRNPIAIVIPCHRVIGASGSLTGYGGGAAGLACSRWRRHPRASCNGRQRIYCGSMPRHLISIDQVDDSLAREIFATADDMAAALRLPTRCRASPGGSWRCCSLSPARARSSASTPPPRGSGRP
jgi:methylated-DNA-[protein]-cysteine S-methyltransferase